MKEYLLKNSVSELLKNPDFVKISLNEWASAIREVYGKVFSKTLIQILKAKINLHDSSEEVNSFLINGNKFWLDKATRVGLMHLANCSTDTLQLVLGNQILTIPVDMAKQFLAQLEVYAGKCYLQTQKHLLALKDLRTIDDIMNYDFTAGYPEKLLLNL